MESWNKKLTTAAGDGDIEALKLCLQNGADIDYRDGGGQTALMRAANRGHLEICRLLIDRGCKMDTTTVCYLLSLITLLLIYTKSCC
ncbi:putative ankyrin repeat protein RF_p14 [Mytilus galloprovincialis]|uniref:putative ankyrin repeat protein RF_p14 n=1 Tax=Mytilus galloprovincialis TaxID=29158 RepID=UPI003F7B80D4